MCGILGVLTTEAVPVQRELKANAARGRDSWGYLMHASPVATLSGKGERVIRRPSDAYRRFTTGYTDQGFMCNGAAIVNMRAEPTTEFVKLKQVQDVQPYVVGDWAIVHNGTIANDKELLAAHPHWTPPTRIDSWVIAALCNEYGFDGMLSRIVGSYAILAINLNDDKPRLHYAVNYRPLYVSLFFDDVSNKLTVSSVQLHPSDMLLRPYSTGSFALEGGQSVHVARSLYRKADPARQARALVVLSGGLDSTVTAAALQRDGYAVELLHFNYGARATGPERIAVEAIAARMGVPLHVVETDLFTQTIKGSRLTNTLSNEGFAESEKGAEYAHEWVPARNLIMVSIAIGIAEARGFDAIALGANLEEAGAYPDNEPEFLKKVNQLIPFAVADGKQLEILTPVGNLMKHEIVKLGLEVNAPMELSWSCYDAQLVEVQTKAKGHWVDGERIPDKPEFGTRAYHHCGKCGPCFMRRTAFEINGRTDPVFAAEEVA